MSRPIDPRTPPCQVLAGGKLCGRTEDRPTVLHPHLGIICLTHQLVPITPRNPKEASDGAIE